MGPLPEGSRPPDRLDQAMLGSSGPSGLANARKLEENDIDLARLADLPVAEHEKVFTAVHQRLADTLSVTSDQALHSTDQPLRSR